MPSITRQQKSSSSSSSQLCRDDNDHDSSSSTDQILVADNNVVDAAARHRSGNTRTKRERGSFKNRGLVMLFFSLCVFLPISQWMRLSTTNDLSVADYFNMNTLSDRSYLTKNNDPMAAAANIAGLSNNYHHLAIMVNTNNNTPKTENSGVVGGAARVVAAAAAKEGHSLSLETQLPAASASLSSAAAEICPTTDMSTTMDVEPPLIHAVTEANEDGFFIRTLYPKTFPIDEIMEDDNGNKQLLFKTPAAVPNNNVGTKVVACEFRHNLPNSNHFPHTMQQLYRCWSWWQYVIQNHQHQQQSQAENVNNNNNTAVATIAVQPVLVLKRNRLDQQNHHQQRRRHPRQGSHTPSMLENRFVQGFLDALKTSINLIIVYQNDDDKELQSTTFANDFSVLAAKPKLESNRDLYDYRMYSIQDGPNLRKAVLQTIIINSNTKRQVLAGNDNNDNNQNVPLDIATETVCNGVFPRITILNRRKNRRILNVQVLQHAILDLLYGTTTTTTQPPPLVDNNTTTTPLVRVEYFEGGRSFAEQVSVLASTDILISPHGAQLTGLPFLPSPCSAVLEIFPRGYWIPKFFGSLAATSGVHQHACFYLGAATTVVNRTHQVQEATRTVRDRFRTRSQNMCLPMNQTLQAIQQMINSWQQCCDSNVHQESSSTTTTTRP